MKPMFCRADGAATLFVEYWDRLFLPLSEDGKKLDKVLQLNLAQTSRTSPEDFLKLAQNLNHMIQGMCVVSGDNRVTLWNRPWLDLFKIDISRLTRNISFEEFIAATPIAFEWPLLADQTWPDQSLNLDGKKPASISFKEEQILEDGRYLEVIAVRLPDGGVTTTVNDISARKAAQRELLQSKLALEKTVAERTEALHGTISELQHKAVKQQLLEEKLAQQKAHMEVTLLSIGDGVIATDASGKLELLNPAAEKILGWTQRQALGRPVQEVFKLINEHSGKKLPDRVEECLKNGSSVKGDRETVLINKKGRRFNIDERISPIYNDDRISGAVIVFRDITGAREEERRIVYQASHDLLTGLSNRPALMKSLENAYDRYQRYATSYAILFIDLDRFKTINDSEGHAAGDEFLQLIAEALMSRTRRHDCVGRFGGDEFIILLENCGLDDACRIAELVRKRINACELSGKQKVYSGSASIGISLFDKAGLTLNKQLDYADQASYAAKRAGGNKVYLWNNESAQPVSASPASKEKVQKSA